MQARDSVSRSLQNARNMSCWRLQQYRIRRIEYSSSFDSSIPMKLDQKREKDERSGLICGKRKSGSRRGFLRSLVRRYWKNLQLFMACIFFSISSGQLDIGPFSCYCIRHELGISWKPSDYSKRKRSILRAHHMKLHSKLNASVLFYSKQTHF